MSKMMAKNLKDCEIVFIFAIVKVCIAKIRQSSYA